MRPLKEIILNIEIAKDLGKFSSDSKRLLEELKQITEITTQQDRNKVLHFLCSATRWYDVELKHELMNHVKKSAGQPVYEPYVIK